ncbi:MAG: ABC transporter permease [bacterium]
MKSLVSGRSRLALAGWAILACLVGTALFAPWLAARDPTEIDLARSLERPSWSCPLGKDALGRDIFSRLVYGARVSVLVGFATVSISLVVGTFLGFVAGYYRGALDEAIMRAVDVLLAFPGILLAVALTAVLGPSLRNVILALCAMGWVGYARLARAQVLTLRELDFVQAARSIGARDRRILWRHLLPNALSPLLVEATFGAAGAILGEAGLSFLGLGTQPPAASWGSMLNDGRPFLFVAPHLTLAPGVAIMTVVLGLNFLGDGLRDRLDVRQRGAEGARGIDQGRVC